MAPVKIYVYDLSGGIVKAVSKKMLGKHFDGVWHTSVIAFGKEIHYRRETGIQINIPGEAEVRCGTEKKRARPVEVLRDYETNVDRQTFGRFLDVLQKSFTTQSYDLWNHNCISFTRYCIKFLTGKSIPSWITGLPSKIRSAIETAWGSSVPDLIKCFSDDNIRKSLTDIVASLLRMVKDLAQSVATLSRDIVKSLGPNIIIGIALVIVACLIS